jgi:hypothetical protein
MREIRHENFLSYLLKLINIITGVMLEEECKECMTFSKGFASGNVLH